MKKLSALFVALFAFCAKGVLFAADAVAAPEAPAAARDQSYWQTIIMVVIAIVFFYFILLRPEQKRRKAMEKVRDSLKKGDRVTAMGIVGTVASIEKDTVVLKMVDGAKVEFLKGAITEVQPSTTLEEPKKPSEEPSPKA